MPKSGHPYRINLTNRTLASWPASATGPATRPRVAGRPLPISYDHNGQAVRCEAPRRAHQAAARRLSTVLDSAAAGYVALHPGSCPDVSNNFDVILWEVPTATIRRPDLALHNCAPDDVRPLPASYIRVIVEVVSPGSDKPDRVEKMGSTPRPASPSTVWCGSPTTGWRRSMSTSLITPLGHTGYREPLGRKTS